MVDTINPQTGKTDSFDNSQQVNTGAGSNYFAGFNKPEGVKVNLAETTEPLPEDRPKVDSVLGDTNTPSFAATPPPVTPDSSQVHTAYSNASESNFNLKAIIFMAIAGVLAVVLSGVGSYFISSAIYNQKLNSANKELADLKTELNNEQQTPAALELPVKPEAPASTQPVTTTPAPAQTTPTTPAQTTPAVETPKVEQAPIETPAPTNPATTSQGTG